MGSKPVIVRELHDDSTTKPTAALQPRPQGVPREIPIDQIHIPGHNIRTEFSTPQDEELAQSIRENGVLERLLVRDNSKWRSKEDQRPDYDLMAGERRLRAAIKAGLASVPCEVFDVGDEKAYEIMLIENLQSKDLHELDYAKGLQIMMKRFGYNVEQTAARIQKGETFVREMLSFSELPASAEVAFRKGAISKSHAVLISTIPDEKKRDEYAKRVLQGKGHQDYRGSGEPLSVRRAKELKEHEYMKDLGKAPFPLDLQLDATWRYSCLTCPHYNGNTPEARQGKRPNICLNPTHYAVMVESWNQSQLKAIEDKDDERITTLSPDKGRALFHDHNPRYLKSDNYVDLDADVYDYKSQKNRKWSSIINEAEKPIVITVDPEGKIRKLATKSDADAAAKTVGVQRSYSSSSSSSSPSEAKRRAAERERSEIRRETTRAVLDNVGRLAIKIGPRKFNPQQQAQFTAMLKLTVRDLDDDCQRFLCKHFQFEAVKGQFGSHNYERPLIEYAEQLRGPFAWAFMAQLLVMEELQGYALFSYNSGLDRYDTAACKAFGVDIVKVQAQQSRLVKEKRKKKPAKAKRAIKPAPKTRILAKVA